MKLTNTKRVKINDENDTKSRNKTLVTEKILNRKRKRNLNCEKMQRRLQQQNPPKVK